MLNKTILKCPVCGKSLLKELKNYTCPANHIYDIAKQGYCNLLLANQKFSKEPGDSKAMVQSRKDFLNTGHYSALANSISEIVLEHYSKCSTPYNILDSGCGEGYYLDYLEKNIIKNNINYYGFDISKEAVKQAAIRNKNITWTVGSSFNMTVLPDSIDCLINVFAPICEMEFKRVLKKGGIIISATPGKEHLFGLKEILYEKPYYNDEEVNNIYGFEIKQKVHIKYNISLQKTEDIKNLLTMTPYFWRTEQDKIKKIDEISNLDTCVHFIITIYEKS